MHYNTKVLTMKGQEVDVDIIVSEVFNAATIVSVIDKNNNVKGSMRFVIKENCLHIIRMFNHTLNSQNSLKHIGRLLLEYAFRKSIEQGKGGRIELATRDNSPAAFYLMGMRARESFIDEDLQELVIKYEELALKHELTKLPQIVEDIIKHPDYIILKENAARCLVLKQCPELLDTIKADWNTRWYNHPRIKEKTDTISFEEVMQWGYESSRNLIFAEYIRSKKALDDKAMLSSEDCRIGGMDDAFMFLPMRRIQKWMNELDLNPVESESDRYSLRQGP